ncbi:Putative ubiquinone biosynthesis monooxygenase [Malassezia vespertilionis]|uniref:Putative ubiquinone biosynthesis monooxygenase n=1 Tax=Malassezia vespertilionis TaxID=2020962 RepID=UPI0024B1E25E|nr:Putative ubiquinone biosynthesis monooxygenase [Malassezia vespertilionis]WFD06652.1 Putative ubiquinone biosynthesis monooxygenase [Malassezia vespertilionis]
MYGTAAPAAPAPTTQSLPPIGSKDYPKPKRMQLPGINELMSRFEEIWFEALKFATDQEAVTSMLRVDHSGEIAANTIYEAQADVFGYRGKPVEKALIIEMWENEKKHLSAAQSMLDEYNARPSLLVPVWSLAGRFLGGVTAIMGEKSAMACTEAVETVIGEHYDEYVLSFCCIYFSQLKHLDTIAKKLTETYDGEKAAELMESIALLKSVLIEFRDDELEHLDTAVEHDSQQAPAHALLSAVVEYGCKGAIEVAKRI